MTTKIIVTTPEELTQLISECVALEMQKAYGKMQNSNNTPATISDYCLIKEAAGITGLSASTIRTKCHHGKMPYFKAPGTKKLQFKRTDLVAWIESGRVSSLAEMIEENNHYMINKRKKH